LDQKVITRRKWLKSFMAGSAAVGASAILPDKWVNPVIETVVLPAHAAVSGPVTGGINGTLINNHASIGGGVANASAGNKPVSDVSTAGQTIYLYLAGTLDDYFPTSIKINTHLKDARPIAVDPLRPFGTLPVLPDPIAIAISDALGKFEFLDVKPGEYELYWKEVNIRRAGVITVTAGLTTIVDFIYGMTVIDPPSLTLEDPINL
jgi:hypothetical protein